MMDKELRWSSPREAAEFMGVHGIQEVGRPLDLDGPHADLLCSGIEEMMMEIIDLRAENAELRDAGGALGLELAKGVIEIERLRAELKQEQRERQDINEAAFEAQDILVEEMGELRAELAEILLLRPELTKAPPKPSWDALLSMTDTAKDRE